MPLRVDDGARLLAVPGSFGRRAAFSNRDYDWFVYGAPAPMAVWTGQWRHANVPCAAFWPGCNASAPTSPPHPSPRASSETYGSLSGDAAQWADAATLCRNEPFECRLAAVMHARNMRFQFYRAPRGHPELVAAICRMPERDIRTHDYDPRMWHTPLGLDVR